MFYDRSGNLIGDEMPDGVIGYARDRMGRPTPTDAGEVLLLTLKARTGLTRINNRAFRRTMSYFYSVRGWLEASPSDFPKIVSTITALRERWQSHDKERLYMKGWCWSDEPINWTRYLFYGADVTEEGLTLLCDTIHEIALLKVEISGYFHARGEDGENIIIYKVDNDVLTEERVSARGSA